MKSIYESTGKGYTQQGDYLLPNLHLDQENEYHIGIWGQRYRQRLKSYHKVIYYNYLKDILYKRLAEVDKCAENMFYLLVKSLAKGKSITENLKANDMLLWFKKMYNIRNRAIKIVNSEVLYVWKIFDLVLVYKCSHEKLNTNLWICTTLRITHSHSYQADMAWQNQLF